MKLRFLFLLTISILAFSCGEDTSEPSGNNVLNYDGENFTAPTFPAGVYEYAVRFPSDVTENVEGRSIVEINFYLYEAPARAVVNVSPDLTPTLPGDIVASKEITSFTPNSWNTVRLNTPFVLDGRPIWVGIEVEHSGQMQTIGCDEGPANIHGDWLYVDETQTWETFRDRTNQNESVNWNIRVRLNNVN